MREAGNRLIRLAAMRGRTPKTLLACVLAIAIAGCGGNDEGTIPSDQADQLLTQLDAMQNDIETGNCALIDDHAKSFAIRVSQLPEDVDPEVRKGLTEASAQVVDLSDEPGQCETVTGASGPEGAEEETTTTEEEPTTTEEETTTTTTTDEEEPTEPEESQGQPEGNEEDQTEQGNSPLEVPGNNGGGTGGRGATESGGVEPGKGDR